MFRMRKLPERFKTKNKILLSNMKVICRPTAGRRDQSANHFLPKKMHSLISDTKICGHLPSHRKQTAFPSTQPRIKKETSATSRFPNYTVVQTDNSIDAYRTEDTILYGIHISYPSNLKESAQAELKKILENGIGQN